MLLDLAYAVELVIGLDARPQAATLYQVLLPYRDHVVVSGVAVAMRGAVAHLLGVLAALLDRTDEAREFLREAVERHDRLGAMVWALRSRLELARLDLPDPAALSELSA